MTTQSLATPNTTSTKFEFKNMMVDWNILKSVLILEGKLKILTSPSPTQLHLTRPNRPHSTTPGETAKNLTLQHRTSPNLNKKILLRKLKNAHLTPPNPTELYDT